MTTATTLTSGSARALMPAAAPARASKTRVIVQAKPLAVTQGLAALAGVLEPVVLVLAATGVSLVLGSVAAGAFAG